MVLTLKKIQHRGAYRIGISFPYSVEVNQKLKSLGAVYSSTLRCWYLDDHAANYQLLQSNFDELVIENPKPEHAKTVQVAGPQSRNLPPIVAQPMPAATKLPEKTGEKPIKGHKGDVVPLAIGNRPSVRTHNTLRVKERVCAWLNHARLFVCRISFHRGFDGYVSFTSKTQLIEHYEKILGAKNVGGHLMVINTELH